MKQNPLSVALRAPPLPHFMGARNRSRNVCANLPRLGFLAPCRGERWRAKRDGEGALAPSALLAGA